MSLRKAKKIVKKIYKKRNLGKHFYHAKLPGTKNLHMFMHGTMSWYNRWHSYAFHNHIHWGVLFLSLGLILKLVFVPEFTPASAADTNDDMLVYRGGGDSSIPEYKTRNLNSGFSSELTASDATGALEYTILRAEPSAASDEKALCTKDTGDDVNCQIYNGTSWSAVTEVGTNAGGLRGFDLAYEGTSGDALVCFRDPAPDTATPNCNVWNGTDWSTTADAISVTSAINNMRLIPDPNSDYIAMITYDTAQDINVQIWDGGAWGNLIELETASGGATRSMKFDGAWEESSGDFLVAWFDDGGDEIEAREFDKVTFWGTQIDGAVTGLSGNDTILVRLRNNPDPTSDEILLAVVDADEDLAANNWTGSAFGTEELLSSNIGGAVTANGIPLGLAYEQSSDYEALLTYGITGSNLHYRVWDPGTTSWGAEQDLPTSTEDLDFHELAADPQTEDIMLTTIGTVNDIQTLQWRGNSWETNFTVHETASNDQFQNAWFVYDYEIDTDTTGPSLASWNLDLEAGTVTLNFDEMVDGTTFDTTELTIQDAVTAVDEYTLTTSTTASTESDQIIITLSAADLNAIKADSSLATSLGSSFIRFTALLVDDLAGNSNSSVVDGAAIQATNFTPDTTNPTLTTWDLDIDLSLLTLNFDEAVDASTLDVTGLTLQDAATLATSYTLTNSTTASSNGTQVIINLSTVDLNAIKLDQSLATALADSFLTLTAPTIDDLSGNAITPITDGSGVQATAFNADSVAPNLSTWSLNLDTEQITLNFDEPVDVSTLDVTGITLQDAATAGTSYTLTDSTTPSIDATTIIIDLSVTDSAAIIADNTLATALDTSYITLTASTIDDMAGNDITIIANGSAQQATSYNGSPTFEQATYRLFNNDDSTDVGTALAPQNMPVFLPNDGVAFRLRTLLEVNVSEVTASGQPLKLQFAPQVGTCDIAFAGETYTDVTAATAIAFNDNPAPADGAAATLNANDPSNTGNTILQNYEELNNTNNDQSTIDPGQDGLWDFALIDLSAPAGTTYCFRLVKADGSLLDTYTVIPQITAVAANAAPVATVPSPVQLTDGSGFVTFTTTISDADLVGSRLKVEYSDDGGSNFYDAEIDSVTPNIGTVDLDNAATYQIGSTDAIDTDTGAIELTIIWDTKSANNGNGALNTEESDIQIRLTPNDTLIDGAVAQSADFSIDNLAPVNLVSLISGATTQTSQQLNWSAVIETNFSSYAIWYGTEEDDVNNQTGSAVEWDQDDDPNLSTISTITTTITGLDSATPYKFKLFAYDDTGNSISVPIITATTLTVPGGNSNGNGQPVTTVKPSGSSGSSSSGGGSNSPSPQPLPEDGLLPSAPEPLPFEDLPIDQDSFTDLRNGDLEYISSLNGDFVDLPKEHWARSYLNILKNIRIKGTNQSILPGHVIDPLGGSRLVYPDVNIKRYQFIRMALVANSIPIGDTIPDPFFQFTDLNQNLTGDAGIDEVKKIMYTAAKQGIVTGFREDQTARPFAEISRAEAVKIALKAAEIPLSDRSREQLFDDVEIELWFTNFINNAKTKGIVNGPINKPGLFEPLRNITTAEAAKLITFSMQQAPDVNSAIKSLILQAFPDSRVIAISLTSCNKEVTFSEFLSIGANSGQTRPLQKLLVCLGHLPSEFLPNGIYDSKTADAVGNFQAANGIEAAGYVGPATREALNRY